MSGKGAMQNPRIDAAFTESNPSQAMAQKDPSSEQTLRPAWVAQSRSGVTKISNTSFR